MHFHRITIIMLTPPILLMNGNHSLEISMTQAKGQSEGGLFDTEDMKPLTDDALFETLKIFEKQFIYGHPNEFEGCVWDINMSPMGEEECVLTLNWGNSYLEDLIRGKLGIAKAVSFIDDSLFQTIIFN